MKVSGFTFVKNAVKYGYPVVESITSLLPIVDEMLVCLGDSDDETNRLIESIQSRKIKIMHSVWDQRLRTGGKVLAVETNKALAATDSKSDWLFYIQADEVLHEKYHEPILKAMREYKDNKRVEGLLFHYHHFYGSYNLIGDGRMWYRKEIRVIRNDKRIKSYRDAQGFRWEDNRKLNVKLIDAYIYHYGWVRNPVVMQIKYMDFGKLWSPASEDEQQGEMKKEVAPFDYSTIDSVIPFNDKHPAVMKQRIEESDWDSNIDMNVKRFKNGKHSILYFLWRVFGWRPFEYRNYRII